MNTKRIDKWICLLFCLLLALMPLLFLLLPKADFSAREKRYLAEAPELDADSLLSGRFAEEAESYAADHLPGRDLLVGLNAVGELVTGRQIANTVWLGRNGRLFEAPAAFDAETIADNMAALRAFAEQAGQPVDLMLVPSAGCLLPEELPALADPCRDEEILDAARDEAGDALRFVALLPAFRAAEDRGALYYRTDHHWTAEGAYRAAALYLDTVGRALPAREDYGITAEAGFRGTLWSRAALWFLPAEPLELWDSDGDFCVENREREGEHAGLFYRERLTEDDKYPVYLDGNHSLVRIRNTDPAAQGRILVVRDSFANCLGCFLADAYEEVVLVDLRYYRSPVSGLLAEGFDQILILYSIGNFMTDANIVRLE